MGADKIWVLNVGDIKPMEFVTDYFCRLAYDPAKVSRINMLEITKEWADVNIDKDPEIKYQLHWNYRLMYERKPEFMGWSRTEPTTQTTTTQFNHFYYGDEAQKRIGDYEALERSVKQLRE